MHSLLAWPTVILLVSLLGSGSAAGQSSLSQPLEIHPDTSFGRADLDLAVRDLDGRLTSLVGYSGKVVFLNFWATWCRPCIEEIPTIKELQRRLGSAPVAILLISVDDDVDPVREFVHKHSVESPVFLRAWERGESSFLRGVVPSTYILSKSGNMRYRHIGSADWNSAEIETFLRRLAQE